MHNACKLLAYLINMTLNICISIFIYFSSKPKFSDSNLKEYNTGYSITLSLWLPKTKVVFLQNPIYAYYEGSQPSFWPVSLSLRILIKFHNKKGCPTSTSLYTSSSEQQACSSLLGVCANLRIRRRDSTLCVRMLMALTSWHS